MSKRNRGAGEVVAKALRRVKMCSAVPRAGGQRGGAVAEVPCEAGLEVGLDGGCVDGLPAAQDAAVGAVEVEAEDLPLEGLAGALPGLDAGEALAEMPAAFPALEFADVQFEHHMAQPPILLAHDAVAAALAAQPDAVAVRAGCGAFVPDPEPHPPRPALNPGNLATGQSRNKLRVDQNVPPDSVLSILRAWAAPVFDQEPQPTLSTRWRSGLTRQIRPAKPLCLEQPASCVRQAPQTRGRVARGLLTAWLARGAACAARPGKAPQKAP